MKKYWQFGIDYQVLPHRNIIVFLDLAMSLFSKSSQEKEIEENSEKKELIKNLN